MSFAGGIALRLLDLEADDHGDLVDELPLIGSHLHTFRSTPSHPQDEESKQLSPIQSSQSTWPAVATRTEVSHASWNHHVDGYFAVNEFFGSRSLLLTEVSSAKLYHHFPRLENLPWNIERLVERNQQLGTFGSVLQLGDVCLGTAEFRFGSVQSL